MDNLTETRWWRARKAARLILVGTVICVALLMIWQGAEQDIREAAIVGALR